MAVPLRVRFDRAAGRHVPLYPDQCDPHTQGPSGYLAYLEWAEKMGETHEQAQCPGCGLWAIWKPREKAGSDDKEPRS